MRFLGCGSGCAGQPNTIQLFTLGATRDSQSGAKLQFILEPFQFHEAYSPQTMAATHEKMIFAAA